MVLSICIPTYNRSQKVISLLRFLREELNSILYPEDIEVIVSDNCSSDNTSKVLSEFNNQNRFFTYHRNEENLGLIGNILKLVDLSSGRYVWFMGDDDIYHEGVVKRVLSLIRKEYYSYIFINHTTFSNVIGDGIQTMLEGIDPNREDSNLILDILKNHPGAPMFMSAEIYEKEKVQEFINKKYPINICLPLGLSIYSASRGKVGLVLDPMIDDDIGNISWTDVAYKVDLYYRPVYYIMALRLPLSFINSLFLFLNYIFERRSRYFYYWIIKPIKSLLKF